MGVYRVPHVPLALGLHEVTKASLSPHHRGLHFAEESEAYTGVCTCPVHNEEAAKMSFSTKFSPFQYTPTLRTPPKLQLAETPFAALARIRRAPTPKLVSSILSFLGDVCHTSLARSCSGPFFALVPFAWPDLPPRYLTG